jgi:GNAT superfamily N-acetyltransferase
MNGTTPSVRQATAADVDVLVALMAEFYAEANFVLQTAAATHAFSSLLSSPSLGAVWIAELGGDAVGHAVVTTAFSMEFGGPRGFIDDLFVRPAYRGRGIGAALLAAARAGAVALGFHALCVETGQEDHPARGLYARAGYVDTGHALLVQPLRPPLHGMSVHEATPAG